MSILLNGDCLEEIKELDSQSVDLIFCDLPYGQTSCKWDCCINLKEFWEQIMRIKKLNTPIFFTTTTKFGVSLINSAPKKCPFRYDIVWAKSASAGFLSAKKMPMRKHEMIYVFYEKLPFYDLSTHNKKSIDKNHSVDVNDSTYGGLKIKQPKTSGARWEPPLPNSVVKEEFCKYDINKNAYGGGKEGRIKISKDKKDHQQKYDPPLPHSLLEIKSTRGKHSTEKPIALIEWILKYYSKEGDVILDPTMGSGSCGVACKNMKRNFIGIEKDKEIYDSAVERIET